jgi:hypothetical protein
LRAIPLFAAETAAFTSAYHPAGRTPVDHSKPRTTLLIAAISAIRVASRAFLIYPVYAERPAVARIAMIAITTISSIRVKPDCFFIRKSKR